MIVQYLDYTVLEKKSYILMDGSNLKQWIIFYLLKA